MRGIMFNSKHLPIAVDLGASRVRLLQLERSGESWRVVAAREAELPSGLPDNGPDVRSVLTETLKGLVAGGGFHGRQCVVSLPDDRVVYKNIRLPRMPADELGQAVVFEARDRFELGDAEAIVQHMVAGEVMQGEEQRQEIIAMAVTDETLRPFIDAVAAAGLTPIAIEVAPTALARCHARTVTVTDDTEDSALRVLVDVGGSGTKVMIVRGRQVAFYKRIDIGGRTLNEAVARHLELPLDEATRLRIKHICGGADTEEDGPLFGSTRRQNVDRAVFESTRLLMQELAKEIGLCLRYYAVTFRGKRPERVLVSGGEAADEQLISIIGEQLDLPVEASTPLEGIDSGSVILPGSSMAEWAVAAGLALRQPFATHGVNRGAA